MDLLRVAAAPRAGGVGDAPLALLGRGGPLQQQPRKALLEHFSTQMPRTQELVLAKEPNARRQELA